MLDLLIRSDRVVTSHGEGAWDVAIRDGTIIGVVMPGTLEGVECGRVIDATGQIVIPGGIDPHSHSKWPTPVGGLSALPAHVSRAALFGGTTTLIDFALWKRDHSLQKSIEQRDTDWQGACHCDYAFHVLLPGEIPTTILQELPELIQAGFPSIKMYTTDGRPSRPGWKVDFGDIWEVLQVLARHGGIACIHAEDNDLVMHQYRKLIHENRVHFTNMAEVHSTLSEDLSFRRIIRLAESIESAALYMMHVSARAGVEAIAESRSKGHPIYGETLHHYSFFTSDDYHRPHGQIYHTYPSLKHKDDQDALWEGIMSSGAISTIGTDGVCTPFAIKVQNDRIDDTVGGSVGVEVRLGVMYTEIVKKRRSTLEHYVNMVSTNASKIMGLYPRKGVIAPGSDADITILDPTPRKIRKEDLHESDYSPWEGYEAAAWPVTTILHGKIAVERGKFFGSPAEGRRINRKVAGSIVKGPAL